MIRISSRFFLLFSICLSHVFFADAQIIARKHAKPGEKAPKALLVQLNTNQRKVDYFSKTKNKKSLKQVYIDTDSVMSKMIQDFTDNFSYCPVYYYIDTNAELVKQQKFTGILLDKNLHPVQNPPLSPADEYFIALYGMPSLPNRQSNEGDVYNTDYTNARDRRLVVMDKNMNVLQKPLPNGSNNVFGGRMKEPASTYKYASPKFDLYYRPVAKHYSAKLRDFYGPYPY